MKDATIHVNIVQIRPFVKHVLLGLIEEEPLIVLVMMDSGMMDQFVELVILNVVPVLELLTNVYPAQMSLETSRETVAAEMVILMMEAMMWFVLLVNINVPLV